MPAGLTNARIIVPVVNSSDSWRAINDLESAFQIFDASGQQLGEDPSNRFSRALPPFIGPGGVSYLLGALGAIHRPGSDFVRVESHILSRAVAERRWHIEVVNPTLSPRPGGGVIFSGSVKNTSEKVAGVDVFAVFFDGNDNIVGYIYDDVGEVGATTERAFAIDDPFTAALFEVGDVASGVFFGGDLLAEFE
jgi:hypothetical protein